MIELADKWGYADMLADLSAGRRFAFVRYSDGDWNCMLGRKGGVPNEHTYEPDLAAALRAALIPEPGCGYHVGIMPSLLTPGRWWASEGVIEYCRDHPHMRFCSSMMIHNASMSGDLGRLFDALADCRVSLVGNASMHKLTPWLGDFRLVDVPASECWRDRDEIVPRIMAAARRSDVVLFACSMPAKVWIRQAWESAAQASLIDAGSVLDPYAGRMSRSYMRNGMVQLAAAR